MVEAAVDPALLVDDTAVLLKVRQELVGLVALALAELHRTSSQCVVELDRLVGRNAALVLRRFRTEPEVKVPAQSVSLLLRAKNDVGISDREATVLLLGESNRRELLDSPDFEAGLGASSRKLAACNGCHDLIFSLLECSVTCRETLVFSIFLMDVWMWGLSWWSKNERGDAETRGRGRVSFGFGPPAGS